MFPSHDRSANAIEALQKELSEAKESLKLKDSNIESSEAFLKEAKEAKAEVDKELAQAKENLEKVNKEAVASERLAKLVSAGLDEETAKALRDKFEGVDDAAFEGIVELQVAAVKKAGAEDKDDKNDKKKEDKEDKGDMSKASLEDNVTPNEAPEDSENEFEATMASAQAHFAEVIKNKAKK